MDFDSAAKIESVIFPLQDAIGSFFQPKEYGPGIAWISVVFNCRDGGPYNLRKRFDKKDRLLMYDIISDFVRISSVSGQEKKDIMLGLFKESVNTIMTYKKKVSDFDFETFQKDWNLFFENYN